MIATGKMGVEERMAENNNYLLLYDLEIESLLKSGMSSFNKSPK